MPNAERLCAVCVRLYLLRSTIWRNDGDTEVEELHADTHARTHNVRTVAATYFSMREKNVGSLYKLKHHCVAVSSPV